MRAPPGPSTDWQENIAPDEAERFAAHAKQFAAMQARKSERWGEGRALHRKQLVAAQGTFEVLDGLPGFAHHGLFERAHDYEAVVRLSNGGVDRAPDRVPDIRGFSLRVLGVRGESALGNGPAPSQDFTLINHEAFAFRGGSEFVDFVMAASQGHGALVKYLVKRYGLVGGPAKLVRFAKLAARRFTGFATETFHSAVPIMNGPYAVRVKLVPASTNGEPTKGVAEDWAQDFAQRLKRRPLHWDLQLQYFANETLTPIEDASVNWPTPYTTVARLMLPKQDLSTPAAQAVAEHVERGVIDPWQALAAHRPLGEVQRLRKVVYFESQRGRGAA